MDTLRTVQIPIGHTELENTVLYFGVNAEMPIILRETTDI
jgi:hypothetical protein